MKHQKLTHNSCPREEGETSSCNICDLFICQVCGGAEGQLLPECPGRRLTPEEHDKNYDTNLSTNRRSSST